MAATEKDEFEAYAVTGGVIPTGPLLKTVSDHSSPGPYRLCLSFLRCPGSTCKAMSFK